LGLLYISRFSALLTDDYPGVEIRPADRNLPYAYPKMKVKKSRQDAIHIELIARDGSNTGNGWKKTGRRTDSMTFSGRWNVRDIDDHN